MQLKCLLQGSLGLLHNSSESDAVLDSHLGQALAVHGDASLVDTVHEGGVVHAEGSNIIQRRMSRA